LTTENAERLRLRLKGFGFSSSAIEAAWPRWWSEEAEGSISARADLRFSLARNLGLDPRSLLADNQEPSFVWRGQARFKHLSTEDELERDAIASFGRALGAMLVQATPEQGPLPEMSGSGLRELILRQPAPYVRLSDLLSLSWSLGIPVIHLTVFPWPQKRMAAMTVRIGDRYAVLLAKDSMYPAPIAFYLAHELGHVALSHLTGDVVVVDFEDVTPSLAGDDPEEGAADRFALEVLTGEPQPRVVPATGHSIASELARVAVSSAADLRIEPGTIALLYGYSTKRWKTANAAMKNIYTSAKPVWSEVNGVARQQLAFEQLPGDSVDYVEAVLGPGAL